MNKHLKLIIKPLRNRLISLTFLLIISSLFILPFLTYSKSIVAPPNIRPYVDYIFLNSNVITVNQSNSLAEAIAITNGKIIAVGDSDYILENYETEGNTTYDLEGRSIMPGIIDGHTHAMASIVWYGEESFKSGQEIALSYGYTTLNEKSFDEAEWAELQTAEANGTLRLRMNLFMIHNLASLDGNYDPIIVERYWPTNNPILDHDVLIRVPGVKFYSDGASGGAKGLPAMTIPYTPQMLADWNGHDPYGELYLEQFYLNATVKAVHDKGFICAFHTMGDRAMDVVLNAIEYSLNGSTNENYRHQIEHNSFLRPDQITKIKNLRTVHSLRGYFPTHWQTDYETIYPPDWLDWTINRYSLPDEGVHAYFESDFGFQNYDPTTLHNTRNIRPFLHMWSLVTKKSLDSNGQLHTPNPWVAEYLLSREQAIRILTIEGAYAVKQEDYLGSIENGKFADLIILSDDPLTCPEDDIKDIDVLLTMINGTIEYESPSYTLMPFNRTDTGLFELHIAIPFVFALISLLAMGWLNKKKQL
jgi:predicted amidohydrolase YtcJ